MGKEGCGTSWVPKSGSYNGDHFIVANLQSGRDSSPRAEYGWGAWTPLVINLHSTFPLQGAWNLPLKIVTETSVSVGPRLASLPCFIPHNSVAEGCVRAGKVPRHWRVGWDQAPTAAPFNYKAASPQGASLRA